MAIVLSTPDVDGLNGAVDALREWQHDGAPSQLHPGDIGWNWRPGAEATADSTRLWSRDGRILALGLLDGHEVLRLTIAPDAQRDDELAHRLVEDLSDPERGVLSDGSKGKVCADAPAGSLVRELLAADSWTEDEPWTPLRRDLAEPVPAHGLRIEVAGPEQAELRTEIHRASFDGSRFSADHWRVMASCAAYADARCLIGYDAAGTPVAAATVWSAGPGRPGLLEPLGVHRDHRGHGHGRSISLAAAAALRDLGSSSAVVCTPSANVVGVTTYRSAGYTRRPEIRDLARP
ncbi:hypothetical protein SAMN05216251_101426 [Actinacidiphila alni]|uniref:N-acetyltransferase domain-containing protein n=1 Tax=Actinacidiphila alni TaxID=380248 RepID=A0A1I1XK35_9ACTN|nr:GNAT family N-acetyltransferase [Actinacidiphila alni]SFE07784.1 hypothetical protein SAMN05216251_101426 [Actinacidiphila alni]